MTGDETLSVFIARVAEFNHGRTRINADIEIELRSPERGFGFFRILICVAGVARLRDVVRQGLNSGEPSYGARKKPDLAIAKSGYLIANPWGLERRRQDSNLRMDLTPSPN